MIEVLKLRKVETDKAVEMLKVAVEVLTPTLPTPAEVGD